MIRDGERNEVKITLRVTKSLNVKIEARCRKTMRQKSEWVRIVLERHFKEAERDADREPAASG